MASKRTIITISEMEKRWLMDYTKTHGISMAEAIRQGIASLKASQSLASYQRIVSDTKGIWRKGDGLKYQDQIRSEWES
ncbi:MAG: hypothetical protein MUP41_16395 [Desulfobacterales bacterium]|jgi:hypothetical protein|nr:hypothetical protein [Desulfobacterales bacterium]